MKLDSLSKLPSPEPMKIFLSTSDERSTALVEYNEMIRLFTLEKTNANWWGSIASVQPLPPLLDNVTNDTAIDEPGEIEGRSILFEDHSDIPCQQTINAIEILKFVFTHEWKPKPNEPKIYWSNQTLVQLLNTAIEGQGLGTAEDGSNTLGCHYSKVYRERKNVKIDPNLVGRMGEERFLTYLTNRMKPNNTLTDNRQGEGFDFKLENSKYEVKTIKKGRTSVNLTVGEWEALKEDTSNFKLIVLTWKSAPDREYRSNANHWDFEAIEVAFNNKDLPCIKTDIEGPFSIATISFRIPNKTENSHGGNIFEFSLDSGAIKDVRS